MVVGDDNDDDLLRESFHGSRTCVVLGGRGFIGRSLVLRLLQLRKWIVRVADSAHSLRLDPAERDSLLPHALASGRASLHHVDVGDKSLLVNALQGSCVVFYIDDDQYTGDFYLSYMRIVQGAKNVINACRQCKVRRLIYNSSSDVVCDGLHDILNGDESLPYPQRFQHSFNELKAEAEALILFANSIDGLLTCAIRPCNVFGPGDTDLVPFIVNLARSSLTKITLGSGVNISDFTYVENVAHAYICVEESLDFQTASVSGKAFFISNLDPMNFRDFSFLILGGLGYQRPLLKLPVSMVRHIIVFMKWMHRKWGLSKLNQFLCRYSQLTLHSATFTCSEAQKLLGYAPVVPLKEGVLLTVKSVPHLANDMSYSRYINCDKPSKVERLLGGANVAEILLWRDEKRSFTCFIASVLLFQWFFLSGRTFASSLAKLCLLLLSALFGYGFLPSNMFLTEAKSEYKKIDKPVAYETYNCYDYLREFPKEELCYISVLAFDVTGRFGFPVRRICISCFEIPEMAVKDTATEAVRIWNMGFHCISSMAQNQDWTNFLKVSALLYLLKVSSQSLTTVVGIALVFFFIAFFIYEQYETEIDRVATHLLRTVEELADMLKHKLPHSVTSTLSNIRFAQEEKKRKIT